MNPSAIVSGQNPAHGKAVCRKRAGEIRSRLAKGSLFSFDGFGNIGYHLEL